MHVTETVTHSEENVGLSANYWPIDRPSLCQKVFSRLTTWSKLPIRGYRRSGTRLASSEQLSRLSRTKIVARQVVHGRPVRNLPLHQGTFKGNLKLFPSLHDTQQGSVRTEEIEMYEARFMEGKSIVNMLRLYRNARDQVWLSGLDMSFIAMISNPKLQVNNFAALTLGSSH